MKNLKTFNEFLNESKLNEAVSIKNAVKLFKDADFSVATFIEDKKREGDTDIVKACEAVCKHLGEKPDNVFIADEYSAEDDERLDDVTSTIKSKMRHRDLDLKLGDDFILSYDPAMHIVSLSSKYDGFSLYYFTPKSKL
jgi:hypothetical protein